MSLDDVRAVFEHSPWVAERAWARGPFRSADALHATMMQGLAGREAGEGSLTADSSSEQGRLGFLALSAEEFSRMQELNRAYREKFGFPCIVALRLHATRESVMQEMQRRSANDPETEMKNALEQIGHITRGRLEKLNLRFPS